MPNAQRHKEFPLLDQLSAELIIAHAGHQEKMSTLFNEAMRSAARPGQCNVTEFLTQARLEASAHTLKQDGIGHRALGEVQKENPEFVALAHQVFGHLAGRWFVTSPHENRPSPLNQYREGKGPELEKALRAFQQGHAPHAP